MLGLTRCTDASNPTETAKTQPAAPIAKPAAKEPVVSQDSRERKNADNSGNDYSPPREIESPVDAARLGIDFYRRIYEEATETFCSEGN